MNKNLPLRLKKEPLLEAVWEIRFTLKYPFADDLLPGLLAKEFSGRYKNIVKLPTADIPDPIAENVPNLRYLPKIRLEADNQAIQIGKRSISLSCRRPYSGWKIFSKDIFNLANAVQNTDLINKIERYSLKYIDLIEISPANLECLNINLNIKKIKITAQPMQLRTEIIEDDISHIIGITSPAEVINHGESEKRRGVLIDIDTIKQLNEKSSWDKLKIEINLNKLHSASKTVFFSLLTQETLNKLEPEFKGK